MILFFVDIDNASTTDGHIATSSGDIQLIYNKHCRLLCNLLKERNSFLGSSPDPGKNFSRSLIKS